jgi:hypothetical protein
MKENGWRRLDAVPITLDIIAPVTVGLLGMLLLPVAIVLGLQRVLPSQVSANTLCMCFFASLFARLLMLIRVLSFIYLSEHFRNCLNSPLSIRYARYRNILGAANSR